MRRIPLYCIALSCVVRVIAVVAMVTGIEGAAIVAVAAVAALAVGTIYDDPRNDEL